MDVKWANKKLGNHIYRNVEVVLSYCIFEYVEKCMCVCVRTRELKPKDMRQTLNLIWIVDSVAKVSLWNENPFHTLFCEFHRRCIFAGVITSDFCDRFDKYSDPIDPNGLKWIQTKKRQITGYVRITLNWKKKVCLMLSDWVGYIAGHGPLQNKN